MAMNYCPGGDTVDSREDVDLDQYKAPRTVESGLVFTRLLSNDFSVLDVLHNISQCEE